MLPKYYGEYSYENILKHLNTETKYVDDIQGCYYTHENFEDDLISRDVILSENPNKIQNKKIVILNNLDDKEIDYYLMKEINTNFFDKKFILPKGSIINQIIKGEKYEYKGIVCKSDIIERKNKIDDICHEGDVNNNIFDRVRSVNDLYHIMNLLSELNNKEFVTKNNISLEEKIELITIIFNKLDNYFSKPQYNLVKIISNRNYVNLRSELKKRIEEIRIPHSEIIEKLKLGIFLKINNDDPKGDYENKITYTNEKLTKLENKYENVPFISHLILDLKVKNCIEEIINKNNQNRQDLFIKNLELLKQVPGPVLISLYKLIVLWEKKEKREKKEKKINIKNLVKELKKVVDENREYFNDKIIQGCDDLI
jgi:hypothetical protein